MPCARAQDGLLSQAGKMPKMDGLDDLRRRISTRGTSQNPHMCTYKQSQRLGTGNKEVKTVVGFDDGILGDF